MVKNKSRVLVIGFKKSNILAAKMAAKYQNIDRVGKLEADFQLIFFFFFFFLKVLQYCEHR